MGHNQSQSSISPTWPISTNHRTASLPTVYDVIREPSGTPRKPRRKAFGKSSANPRKALGPKPEVPQKNTVKHTGNQIQSGLLPTFTSEDVRGAWYPLASMVLSPLIVQARTCEGSGTHSPLHDGTTRSCTITFGENPVIVRFLTATGFVFLFVTLDRLFSLFHFSFRRDMPHLGIFNQLNSFFKIHDIRYGSTLLLSRRFGTAGLFLLGTAGLLAFRFASRGGWETCCSVIGRNWSRGWNTALWLVMPHMSSLYYSLCTGLCRKETISCLYYG